MNFKKLIFVLSILLTSFILISCQKEASPEPEPIKNETTTGITKNIKGGIGPHIITYGTKVETQYVFHHYVANSEFGIWPTDYRQYAGSSGDTTRIRKLNELKSKWGFNFIAAHIGNGQNISSIVNAGFPRMSNYMAILSANQGGEDAAANCCNGLASSDYFWAYYTDEPYSTQSLTPSSFNSFRNYVKGIHPNSLFGFSETNYWFANFYTNNPYLWVDGYYHINYNPTQIDFLMCSRYDNYSGTDNDQRPVWDGLKNYFGNTFSRTWISANKDGGEFVSLLAYCQNYNIAPWFYQSDDAYDSNDQMISSYCQAAWQIGYLTRYCTQWMVYFHCIVNHDHQTDSANCVWVEDSRIYQGIVQY